MKLPKPDYDQDKAFAYLCDLGRAADYSTLNILRLTANVSKHSEGKSADKLLLAAPELFDQVEMARFGDKPGYEYLRLTDEWIEKFFETVLAVTKA